MIVPKEKVMCFVLAAIFIITTVPLPTTHASMFRVEHNTRSGKTFIVNASGGGDFTHIQWAVDNASNEDIIQVDKGIYFENIVIDKTIHLIGAGRNKTIIDGGSKGTVIEIKGDDVSISEFGIVNSSEEYSDEVGIESRGDNNRIENNYVEQNGVGICVFGNNNTIENNSCNNNSGSGISLINSDNHRIAGNSISSNGRYGIHIYQNNHDVIINNTMSMNGIDLEGSIPSHWNSHTIDVSNIVNGKPVYYFKNSSNVIVPRNAGQILLANCTDMAIDNLKFLYLFSSSGV